MKVNAVNRSKIEVTFYFVVTDDALCGQILCFIREVQFLHIKTIICIFQNEDSSLDIGKFFICRLLVNDELC